MCFLGDLGVLAVYFFDWAMLPLPDKDRFASQEG